MGRIVASCKHELKSLEDGHPINIKDIDKHGNKVINSIFVCSDCLTWYQHNNLICYSEDQEKAWLNSNG